MGSYRGGAPPGDPQPATLSVRRSRRWMGGGAPWWYGEGPNLPNLCPGQPPGTVPRKRCSGQVFSITAGLGGAFTPRFAAPARYLVVDPDDGLQGDDPTLSSHCLGGGGGGPPGGGETGPTSAAHAPASVLEQDTVIADQAKCLHRRLGWEGHSTRDSRPLPGTLWWSPTTAFKATYPIVNSCSSGGASRKGGRCGESASVR